MSATATKTTGTTNNPNTWVRDTWERAGIRDMDARSLPAETAEAEWDMITKHVLRGMSYAEIAANYSEPASRIRGFVEAATRRLLPKESIQSEAGEFGGDVRAISALVAAQNLYVALGSPFGGDPAVIGPFFQAIAQEEGVIHAIRAALSDVRIELPSGSAVAIAPANTAAVVGGESDGGS